MRLDTSCPTHPRAARSAHCERRAPPRHLKVPLSFSRTEGGNPPKVPHDRILANAANRHIMHGCRIHTCGEMCRSCTVKRVSTRYIWRWHLSSAYNRVPYSYMRLRLIVRHITMVAHSVHSRSCAGRLRECMLSFRYINAQSCVLQVRTNYVVVRHMWWC